MNAGSNRADKKYLKIRYLKNCILLGSLLFGFFLFPCTQGCGDEPADKRLDGKEEFREPKEFSGMDKEMHKEHAVELHEAFEAGRDADSIESYGDADSVETHDQIFEEVADSLYETDEGAAESIKGEQDTESHEIEPRCRQNDDPLKFLSIDKDLVPGGDLQKSTAQSRLDSDCMAIGFSFVAAKGMTLEAKLTPLGGARFAPRLQVFDTFAISKRGPAAILAQDMSAPGHAADVSFQVPWSGEHVLVVSSADLHGHGTFAIEVHCTDGCSLSATRYPIVLLHGIAGWKGGLLNVVDYFFEVQDTLIKDGYDVYAPVSASFNDQNVRAVQFAGQIDDILASTGAVKVNLVAHSQGGLDGRYIISSMGYGDRVSALVTVSTPHKGTSIADAIMGLVPGLAQDMIAPVVDFIGKLLGTGDEQDIKAAMKVLTTDYVRNVFNPANPDDPRVLYFSFAGHTCGKADIICQVRNNGESVDPILIASFRIMQILEGDNDGLVGVESAKYGNFLGLLSADHWDEIGQLADVVNLSFNHKKFYEDIAAMLAKMGF
ncbi:MAG: triacylglycerol lipase [Deltaproteobacteria bacterium]|nr:triacylglycerol lipase [Deltaproteobacteria bacterium]